MSTLADIWRRYFADLFRGPWTWRRLGAWPLVLLVRIYQAFVSPVTPPSCRFYPSCSSYAVTALLRFGPIQGSWLAARRLARCHPWNAGGVDHVPERPEPTDARRASRANARRASRADARRASRADARRASRADARPTSRGEDHLTRT